MKVLEVQIYINIYGLFVTGEYKGISYWGGDR